MRKFFPVLVISVAVAGGVYVNFLHESARLRDAINTTWLEVDAMLATRADLVPVMLRAVQESNTQDPNVFRDVANARSGLVNGKTAAERIPANARLDLALAQLMTLAETNPHLKSNAAFIRVSGELAGTEDRITETRRRYNQALREYNNYIAMFPNNVMSKFSGDEPNDHYLAAPEETAPNSKPASANRKK